MPREKLSDVELADARRQICDVSRRLFADNGYEAVTMRAIAAELGWSAMTTYRYFKNKQQIFAAVREMALLRLAEQIDDAVHPLDDPLARLRTSFLAYARFAMDHPYEYTLAFEVYEAEMAAFPISTEDTLRSWRISYEAADAACREGLLTGSPNLIVHLLWGGVHGLIELASARRLLFGLSFDDLIEPMIDTVLARFTPVPCALT